MLKLFNKEHIAIGALTDLKDYKIEYMLNGEDLVEFSLSISDENIHLVEEEGYVRNKLNEYVIKAIDPSQNFKRFSCIVNLESLKGKAIANFDTSNNSITDTIRLAIAGTGWILADNNITKRRTVRLKNTNALEVLREIRKVFRVDFRFDAINKIIHVYENFGSDRGVYFSDELNLRTLDIASDTYDYVTRIIPRGKDGLTIASINEGKNYIDNYQYSNKIIEYIWEDNRYTDINSLKADAKAKLAELSKPKRSYQATISDLAKQSKGYLFLDFFLGDTITLLSKTEKFRDRQRIVKYVQYPNDPAQNTCELGNTVLTFEDLQKENEYKNQVVNNITSDNGTVDGSKVDSITTEQISDFKASVVEITDLNAVNAEINNLKAHNVTITGELTAIEGEFGSLTTNVATIDKLVVKHDASITDLSANKANITDLNAVNATIQVLEANVGNIQTLVNGNLSSENIQVGGITGDSLNMKTIFVDDANIVSVNASKINTGEISTNKVKIKSDDGGIEIIGTTLQFKDKNNKVRIQMGKDAKGDFNFIIRGEDGQSILIDNTGVKEKAIANDLIKSNMIASNSVGEKQIDYSSFSEGFNKDTNTYTLNATKIKLNNQNQTLDVAFNSLKKQSDSNKTLTESHSTTIKVLQGQISTAINNTQIIRDDKIILLKDDYNRTIETVDALKNTIGKHTTLIDAQTGAIKGVETKVNTFERDLQSMSLKVTETKSEIDNLRVGGRNYIPNSEMSRKFEGYQIGGKGVGTIEYAEFQGRKCIKFTNVGHWELSKYLRTAAFDFPEGENLTFSMDVYITKGSKFYIDPNEGLDPCDFPISIPVLNKWTRIKGTSSKKSIRKSSVSIAIYAAKGDSISGYITLLKAETGTKATDWTPAASDIEKEITTTHNKVSAIEVNLNNIASKISSVETINSNMNSKVSNLLTRMNVAEQKMTTDSIVSIVGSQFYKKGETDSMFATKSQFSQLSDKFEFQIQNTGMPQLVPNGDLKNGFKFWYTWNAKHTLEFNQSLGTYNIAVAPDKSKGYISFGEKTPSIDVEAGKTYTASFWVSSDQITELNYCFLMVGDVGVERIPGVKFGTTSGIMKRVSITFKAQQTRNVHIFLGWEGNYKPGIMFRIKELCCYEGTVSYAYRPADNEIYAGITYVDQTGVGVKHSDGSYSKMTADSVVFTNTRQQKKMAIKKGSLYAYDVNNGDLLGMFASNKVTSHYRGVTTGLTGSANYFAIGATTELTDDDQLNMVPYILIAQQDLHNFLGNSLISGGINFMNTPCIFHKSPLFNVSPRFKGGFSILKDDGSPLNIYHAKNSIYIESNLTLPTGGSFYGGGLYGGDITSIGYNRGGKYTDVIKLYSNIQQVDFLRPLNMNGFGIYNATLAASYSLNSSSPGRSVGADTASVETMLLQEDFSSYDEENNAVIVNINEAVKSIYEKNKQLENENEILKLDKENLIKELNMTKNVVDNLLMGVV